MSGFLHDAATAGRPYERRFVMQIVCPACTSEYEIPTDRVGAEGRSVRCAACRETWFIGPDDVAAAQIAEAMAEMSGGNRNRSEDQAALDAWESALAEEGIDPGAPSAAEPEATTPVERPRPAARRAKPPRKPRPSLGALGSGAAACLGFVGLIGLALVARSTVVRAMPQSASLYASIGLPVNLRGIDLRDVAAYQTIGEGGVAQLVVEGDLVGLDHQGVAVPSIAIQVHDERGQTLYRWSIPAPRPMLADRERARFRASLSAPPVQGRSVQVRFAEADQLSSENPALKPDVSRRQP